MNWNEALTRIRENIKPGDKIDPGSTIRVISNTYEKNGEKGYRVRVGEDSHLKISELMLETLFNASLANRGIYNGEIFRSHYQRKSKSKPCYIHVVGKIFVEAGIARQLDKRDYEILE